MESEEEGFDDRARDPYDHWVVRCPSLHRAVRKHRFTIVAVCFVVLAAVITPGVLSVLSHRAASTPSAAAATITTSTTTPFAQQTVTATSAPTTTTGTAEPPTATTTPTPTTTTTTTGLARPNASPDPFQSNAQLLPTSSTGKGTSETVAAPTGTANATGSGTPASFSYSGLWDDTEVTLRVITARSAPAVAGVAGQLTAFVTDDPNAACLTNESGLTVHAVKGDPSEFLVRAISPTDCTTAEFVFTTR